MGLLVVVVVLLLFCFVLGGVDKNRSNYLLKLHQSLVLPMYHVLRIKVFVSFCKFCIIHMTIAIKLFLIFDS